jgi:hypothetical protein
VIDGISTASLTAASLLGITVLLILTGMLVPRRILKDAYRDRDEWKAAFHLSEWSRLEQSDQVGELLEHAKTADALLRALPRGGVGEKQ